MRTVLIVVMMLKASASYCQIFETPSYPQGYFRNPLNIPMSLSGNFGELRANHYHMGLDLRTNKVENLPVHAATDGYIARVKIEPGGFGRAIYIIHPNGYTTLYAHLNAFFPALDNYIKQKQYEKESWAVTVEIDPSQFPVKKGDFIAYSGNTGGSQAPHLHFEIRRTSDEVNLNPMLFGFPLPDNTTPNILRLAIYDRTKSVYEQAPKLLPVKKSGKIFITTPPVITVSAPKVSLAISAYDTHSGSTNANGIYEAVLYDQDQPVVGFRMDDISYNDTRYLNAHIDYRTRALGGPYLQNLAELPGYMAEIYKEVNGNGTLDLSDGEVHNIRIVVKDAYGNASNLETRIQYKQAAIAAAPVAGKMFYPMMIDGNESANCEFFMGEASLYDSVHIRYAETNVIVTPGIVSATHIIGATHIPLHSPMLVRIKSSRTLTQAEKDRTVMLRVSGSKREVLKVQWNGDWASASFREFGQYQLILDQEPPVVVPVGFKDGADLSKASRIVFTIKDNNSSFKNVRAELDGKWLRFTNDKGRTFIYIFDEKCLAGNHELTIRAQDEAGNSTSETFHFTR